MKERLGLLSFILSVFLLFSANAIAKESYTIIGDAGSTSTKLYLFKHKETHTIPQVEEIFSKKIKPGLSDFAGRPEAIGVLWDSTLSEIKSLLVAQGVQRKDVEIHILATGGMRFVPEDKQAAIYGNLREYIANNYDFKLGEFKTIDGSMEGVYGWLAVNYLKGSFENGGPTVGIIDVGGASAEIAFEVSGKASAGFESSEEKVQIEINDRSYMVYSRSFLGLGQDRAREAMKTKGAGVYCYPRGYEFSENQKGAFDFNVCSEAYASIIDGAGANRVGVPKAQVFYAPSAIYYTHFFFQPKETELLSDAIKTVCQKDWATLRVDYPDEGPFLSTHCPNGAYLNHLVENAFGLPKERVVALDELNGKSIEWALGAALHYLVKTGEAR